MNTKSLLIKIFPKFSNITMLEFIGSAGCTTRHKDFGSTQLTPHQLKYSSGQYKADLYSNFINCLVSEVEMVHEGIYSSDEPIVSAPYINLLKKCNEDVNKLNQLMKYPELVNISNNIEQEAIKFIQDKVKEYTKDVDSKMPYKQQFTMECVLELANNWKIA